MWSNVNVALVMTLAGSLLAADVAGQEPTSPPVSVELAADLQGLSAADFKTRELAMRRLSDRKLAAIAPLAHLAGERATEASVRAFELLRRIYRAGDDATHEAVESVLESLLRSEDLSVVARAEAAVEEAAPIRHTRAVVAFRGLGGIIRFLEPQEALGGRAGDGETTNAIKYAMLGNDWTGGDDGLKYLRRIEDFRIQSELRGAPLYVTKKCRVSKEAVADLQGTLPHLVVQHRGPACLGISPYIPFGGQVRLQVASVEPGSAADRAGLRSGDFILKFNDFEVTDFETLVDKISDKLPGDKVPVVYERNFVENTTIVELRSW